MEAALVFLRRCTGATRRDGFLQGLAATALAMLSGRRSARLISYRMQVSVQFGWVYVYLYYIYKVPECFGVSYVLFRFIYRNVENRGQHSSVMHMPLGTLGCKYKDILIPTLYQKSNRLRWALEVYATRKRLRPSLSGFAGRQVCIKMIPWP